ncbi:MAG: tetratricopeptide repeat protein [Bacteroidia bacterium]|nr:tetratricopeptide repeat protein [Bacteroidia bacterium]
MQKKSPLQQYLPHLFILVFSFILYGNTITHRYALDDTIVITMNAFTEKGFKGIGDIFSYDSFTGFFGKQKTLVAGGRYRPLSIASFAVERGLLGEFNPGFSHFLNILFYALTGMLIFVVLLKLFKPLKNESWYLAIPFVTVLLFIVHPLHTEVVANIKGRDEIFALMFSFLALYFILKFVDSGKKGNLIWSFCSLFLGLLSKENAILFVVIIPLTLYFFRDHPLRKYLLPVASLAVAALLFLWIRYLVLGYINSPLLANEILNNPFLGATISQKAGTILYTFLIYFKLLVFPYPLTHDYYPFHIQLVPFTNALSLISFVICLVLIIYALVSFRKRSIPSYGILFYFLTLFIVSNILFAVGTFMNERFIYMPSFGFVLIVAWLLTEKLKLLIIREKALQNTQTGILLVILILFSITTISRNNAWKDDFTLFTTDVAVSANSTKNNTSAGGQYLERAQVEKDPAQKALYFSSAFKHLNRAIEIYPGNKNSILLLGNAMVYANQDYKGGIEKFMTILAMDRLNRNAYNNTIKVLGAIDNTREADYKITISNRLLEIDPGNGEVNYIIGKLYAQQKGDFDTAIFFFRKAEKDNSNNSEFYKDIGVVYALKEDYENALVAFNRALALNPQDTQVQQNLRILQNRMNQR